MSKYIMLVRGINVGGKNSLPMKSLKEILENQGCRNIKTYIQSGNVVFEHKDLAKDFKQAVAEFINRNRGFSPEMIIMSADKFKNTVRSNPFPSAESAPKTLHFFFLESTPEKPDLTRLMALKANSESFQLINDVFYLYAPEGIGRSKLAAKVEKCVDVPATARNWNTVEKLLNMVEKG